MLNHCTSIQTIVLFSALIESNKGESFPSKFPDVAFCCPSESFVQTAVQDLDIFSSLSYMANPFILKDGTSKSEKVKEY